MIRYSPRPLADYVSKGSPRYGPATSSLLKTVGSWNLAYLSFDYELSLQPLDPHFTVHVRKTCQTLLDGSGLDIVGQHPPSAVVESLLLLPAPRFVHLIQQHPILPQVPMYLAYGDKWLETITARSHVCQTHEDPPDNVEDLAAARDALAKYLK
jgi:hypothetical protein